MAGTASGTGRNEQAGADRRDDWEQDEAAPPPLTREARWRLEQRVRQSIEALVDGTVQQLRTSMASRRAKDAPAGGDQEARSPLDRAVGELLHEQFPGVATLSAASREQLNADVAADVAKRVAAALNAIRTLSLEKALEVLSLLLLPAIRERLRITDQLVKAIQYQCRGIALAEAEAGKVSNKQSPPGVRMPTSIGQILPEDRVRQIPEVLRNDIRIDGVRAIVRETLAACSCGEGELAAWESAFLPKHAHPRADTGVAEEEPEERPTRHVPAAGGMVLQGSYE